MSISPVMANRIEQWPLDKLIPYARNARTHSDAQVAQIAASIVEFGFTAPILVSGDGGILAGHGRLMAARKLALEAVPVVVLDHLTQTQRRAYILADNQLALQAGWDEELLRLELQELEDFDFDLSLIGFDDDELADLFAGEETTTDGNTDEDEAPEVPINPVSKPSDVWVMGEHRLLCGDSTDAQSFELLMQGEKADMTFTDPPYNVDYANSAKDKIRGTHRPIMNDNLGDDFHGFLLAALKPTLAHCQGGIYVAMSSSELDTLQSAFRQAGGKWSTFIIWAKNTFTLGRADYQRQYEPILYGWPEGATRHWCGDRNQGDVWHFNKPRVNDLHPCLCPGSEVLTDKGWRIIESLVEGDRVLAADGEFHRVEWVSSHAIDKPVFRLSVAGVDQAVDATGNHPFLVLRDGSLAWIEASQIMEGDQICSPAKALSPEKAISEGGTAIDCAWSTTSCGSATLGPSPKGTASTTSTTTNKTITFQTCNLSPTLSTSGFTPVASCAMVFGTSPAMPAEHSSQLRPSTGISAPKAIPTDGAADHATSRKSYSFVLRSVVAVEQVDYSGLVWNLSVEGSPTFETRIGMSHNTMKPVELVEKAIRNSSRPGDIVLDPFGGSGTTLIAAEKSGRKARLIELDPKYVDVIVRRWQEYSGTQAVREADGALFDALLGTSAADEEEAPEAAL